MLQLFEQYQELLETYPDGEKGNGYVWTYKPYPPDVKKGEERDNIFFPGNWFQWLVNTNDNPRETAMTRAPTYEKSDKRALVAWIQGSKEFKRYSAIKTFKDLVLFGNNLLGLRTIVPIGGGRRQEFDWRPDARATRTDFK